MKLLPLLNSCIATNWVYVNINGSQLQTSAYSLSIWCSCIWEKQNWIPYKCWNVDEGSHHQLFLFVCAPHHYIIIQFNWLAIMILLSSLTLFFILFNLNAIPYSVLILFRIYVNFSKAISHSFNFFCLKMFSNFILAANRKNLMLIKHLRIHEVLNEYLMGKTMIQMT